jgi:sulfoxide reductase heme-binding subunit YedZ
MNKTQLFLAFKIASWLPLAWLLIDITFDQLGANPIQAVHIRLGDWSIRFLCVTLTITPLQTLTAWRGLSDYRRMFGLFTFVYASLHLLAYLSIDHDFVWQTIAIDILESPYIWFGVLAYGIVLALAATTPVWSKKKMGKNWKKLHRLIYLAVIAAVLHYFWQLKGNLAEPMLYLLITTILLGFRILLMVKNRKASKLMIPRGRKKTVADPLEIEGDA